jgi:hypothetical protein
MDRAALGRKMAKIVILGGVFDPPKRGHFGGVFGGIPGGILHAKTSKLTILMKNIKIPPPIIKSCHRVCDKYVDTVSVGGVSD